MSYQPITDYVVIRHTVVLDAQFNTTFARDVKAAIDLGYQPYGKPILTPERIPGFTEPQIVGYQTMVKYATRPEPISVPA